MPRGGAELSCGRRRNGVGAVRLGPYLGDDALLRRVRIEGDHGEHEPFSARATAEPCDGSCCGVEREGATQRGVRWVGFGGEGLKLLGVPASMCVSCVFVCRSVEIFV
jgi:hypothetical protein